MKPKKPARLGPWSGGLNLRDDPWELRVGDGRSGGGELVEAVNINLGGSGLPSVRDGWVQLSPDASHSGFEYGGRTYAVVDGTLGIVEAATFMPIMAVSGTLSWTVLDGFPTFADSEVVRRIVGDTVEVLPTHGTPNAYADQVVAQMPGGSWLSRWNGRLILARGTSIYFSEPLWYGVYDTARGILPLETQIRWMAPLESGIYVGLKDHTMFLAGRDPYSLTAKTIPGRTVDGAAAVVSTRNMSQELVGTADEVAVWFSESGFTVGRPDGSVLTPQAERLAITDLGRGKLSVVDDRITLLPT